jgi:hypothetical protein
MKIISAYLIFMKVYTQSKFCHQIAFFIEAQIFKFSFCGILSENCGHPNFQNLTVILEKLKINFYV